jgi:hypothetical protein
MEGVIWTVLVVDCGENEAKLLVPWQQYADAQRGRSRAQCTFHKSGMKLAMPRSSATEKAPSEPTDTTSPCERILSPHSDPKWTQFGPN